jgi:hypothetical protein
MAQDRSQAPREADQDADANSGKSGYEPGKGSRANQARQTGDTAVRRPTDGGAE